MAAPAVDHVPAQRIAPLYSFSEADRLAGVTRGTSRRWLSGYVYRKPDGVLRLSPAITRARQPAESVSFLDLLEVVGISALKARGFTLGEIRRVVTNCQAMFNDPWPLSNHQFKVGGRDIFVAQNGRLHDVLHHRGAMAWDQILGPFLETLDYEGIQATRWWPLGREFPVVIDPDYGFGLPVIRRSGVRTEVIRERMEAGDSIDQIASDFNLPSADVESALRFELRQAA